MNNIMVDLETMDTANSAVVASIGAVAFDPYTNALGARFYVELTEDLHSQTERGRTISPSTMQWWMQQTPEARALFENPCTRPFVERATTADALNRFTMFVEANGGRDVQLWGNGADFDNIILGELYTSFGFKRPWSYSRNRCFRTIKSLEMAPKMKQRVGTYHNAFADALSQAKHLQEIFACLKIR